MKKYLYMLLFMAVALFSAVTMVSCGDDDDDISGGGSSSANTVRRVYIFDNGNQYLNVQYKLTVGSETKVLKLSELKKETAAPGSVESKAGTKLVEAKQSGTVDVYIYDIPATMHGDAHLNSDFSIKAGVELPEQMDVLIAAYIGIGDEHSIFAQGDIFLMKGVLKEKLQEYLDRRNAASFGSCTLK